MKLRYYLRGLGIGIFVTALVMGLSNQNEKPLTDAEIKAKAATLGMVESASLQLGDVTRTEEPSDTEPAASSEPAVSSETAEEPEATAEPTEAPEATKEPEAPPTASPKPTAEPTPSSKPAIEPTATPTPTLEPTAAPKPAVEPTEAPVQGETVVVTVKSGSGSETVCKQLKEAGLIEDAAAFNTYLVDGGYSKRICVGTFEIGVGATQEEIAKIITKTR